MRADLTAFPLCWPAGYKRASWPEKSLFRIESFARARDEVLGQLHLLGATAVTLSSNVQLRNDGLPRADSANPHDAGVAVYFTFKARPMVLACDRWRKVTENLWAIAKTVEAMRGISRWGVSDMLERAFTGFQQLPASTERTWREVFGYPGTQPVPRGALDLRYRELAFDRHPDRQGGSNAAMAELNAAYDRAKKEISQ